MDSELLLDGSYLSGGVGVEVRLFELINQLINFVHVGLYDAFLSFYTKRNGRVRLDTDGSIEVVVAIFEFLHQRYSLLVGVIKFSPNLTSKCLCSVVSMIHVSTVLPNTMSRMSHITHSYILDIK